MADVFRRAVVKLRDGVGNGRCREVAVGADFDAEARSVGQTPPAQVAARSRLLRADVFHMELVGDALCVAAHEGGAGAVGVVLHRAASVVLHGVEHARGLEGHAEAHQVGDIFAGRVGGHRLADADRTVGEDRVGERQFRSHGGDRVVGDGFHFAVAGREGEARELRLGFRPHPAVGVFPGLAHAEVIVRGRAVEVGAHGTCQQLDVAQAVGADESVRRIERDRESLARNGLVRYAERPGGNCRGEAGRGIVFAQRQLVGGDFVKGVEQSLPFAELVAHREQQFPAQSIDLFGLVTQRHGGGRLRGHVEVLDHSARHGPSVRGDLPKQPVGREVREKVFVVDVHDALFQVAGRGVDRPVLVLHFVGVGMPRAVGGQHAVAAEGAVRSVHVVVVAAVTVGQPAFGAAPGERLVGEVPDEPALVLRFPADHVPVLLEAAHRVAHGVGVFALDQRFRRILRKVFPALLVAPVHRADDVGVVVLVIGGLLVLHRARRIEGLDPVVATFEVGSVAGLVARAPDDDRGVVVIAQHHAAVAVEVRGGEGGVAGQVFRLIAVVVAVRLDVGLVHDIETVLVAEVVPQRRVGIMARAHGVHVEPLHLADVAHHLLAGYVIARVRLYFVAVDAFDQDGFAVDEQLSAADFDLAESDAEGSGLGYGAVGGQGFGRERVEVRGLGAPLLRGGDLERRFGCVAAGTERAGVERFARRVEERQPYAADARRRGHFGAERAVAVVVDQIGRQPYVGQPAFVTGIEVAVAADARETPEVLVLEERAVAPAVDAHHDQVVAARRQVAGDVEFGFELAVLAVARFAAVDPERHVRGGRADVDEYVAALPVGGNRNGAAVESRVVLFVGNQRGAQFEELVPRVGFVRVNRVAVAVQLPDARHRHCAPRRIVVSGAEEPFGFGSRAVHAQEGPFAVERAVEGRAGVVVFGNGLGGRGEGDETRAHRGAADVEAFGIEPALGGGFPRGRRGGEECEQQQSFHFSVVWGWANVVSEQK